MSDAEAGPSVLRKRLREDGEPNGNGLLAAPPTRSNQLISFLQAIQTRQTSPKQLQRRTTTTMTMTLVPCRRRQMEQRRPRSDEVRLSARLCWLPADVCRQY
jgi:hypothetical protein